MRECVSVCVRVARRQKNIVIFHFKEWKRTLVKKNPFFPISENLYTTAMRHPFFSISVRSSSHCEAVSGQNICFSAIYYTTVAVAVFFLSPAKQNFLTMLQC